MSATSLCQSYLDWDGLGEELLKRDGAAMTSVGLVTCGSWCCERLPEKVVETKLFSLLEGTLEDEEEYQSSFSAYSLVGYEYDIKKAIEQDFIQNVPKGLAEYLDNQLLKQRVISMFPTVETYRNQLWGVLKVKSRGQLLPEEWKVLRDEWTGQCSDGWGEGFEQDGIDCGEECTLFVHFYNDSMEIKTEQELKGTVEERQEPLLEQGTENGCLQMGGME